MADMRTRIITYWQAPCRLVRPRGRKLPGWRWLMFVVLSLVGACTPMSGGDGELMNVQRPDGSRQCRDGGEPAAAMGARLAEAGIPVHCSEKARDGRARVAVCGAPSGAINVYTIPAVDLNRARELGFDPLPDTATGLERCTDADSG